MAQIKSVKRKHALKSQPHVSVALKKEAKQPIAAKQAQSVKSEPVSAKQEIESPELSETTAFKSADKMENVSTAFDAVPVETVNPKILRKDDLILDIRPSAQHQFIYLKQPHWHVEAKDVHPLEFIKDYGLDGKKKLYIICTTGQKSAEKAREFIQAGFKNVASVDGGIMGAKYAGLPVFEEKVSSIQQQVPLAAGLCVLIGLVGGFLVSNWFYLLPLMAGIGLVSWGITGECTIEKILAHMPWNNSDDSKKESEREKNKK